MRLDNKNTSYKQLSLRKGPLETASIPLPNFFEIGPNNIANDPVEKIVIGRRMNNRLSTGKKRKMGKQ